MKLYKLVKVSNITKLCLFDLRVAAGFFELKRHHLTHQVVLVQVHVQLLQVLLQVLVGVSLGEEVVV